MYANTICTQIVARQANHYVMEVIPIHHDEVEVIPLITGMISIYSCWDFIAPTNYTY